MHNELQQLQRWYMSQCDGDWEHTYGLRIETLDNPGWSIEIDVSETELEDRPFAPIRDMESPDQWMMCRVVDGKFRGDGGPTMLGRMLQVFLHWAGEAKAGEFSAPAV